MRIAVLDDYAGLARQADWSMISADVEIFQESISPADSARILRPFDIICLMRERTPFPSLLIRALPNLKLLAITGRRNASLDWDAASASGVTVCYTPGRESDEWSTAELAWGLLLACARQIPQEDAALRQRLWQTRAGFGLRGKTLGLMGLGRVGRQMAHYAHAFGMDCIAWSPNLTIDRAAAVGVKAVSKAELFTQADAVSLHLVLSERTAHIVGEREICLMRRGATLLNTSRAGLIDEPALLAALRQGRIQAGLDVFPEEPLSAGSPYIELPNCVLAPHIGFVTAEAMNAFYEGTVEVVRAFLSGAPVRVITG